VEVLAVLGLKLRAFEIKPDIIIGFESVLDVVSIIKH